MNEYYLQEQLDFYTNFKKAFYNNDLMNDLVGYMREKSNKLYYQSDVFEDKDEEKNKEEILNYFDFKA